LRIGNAADDEPVRDLFIDRPAFDAWAVQYRARLRAEDSDDAPRRLQCMRSTPNTCYAITSPRTPSTGAKKDFSEVARLQADPATPL
jgi:uncharacterized protein YdiU (UPF0061 family)